MVSASPLATEPGAADARRGFEAYASALYALPGVAEACLDLQDREGADVNLLLLACWLASRGVRLDAAAAERLRAVAAAWRGPVLVPLRRARRALRPLVAELASTARGERAARLRSALAAVELEAERLVEGLLETEVGGLQGGAPADRPTARANLERLLPPGPRSEAVEVLLAAALGA